MPSSETQYAKGQRVRQQSLAGYKCPQCKTGLLKLRHDGTNECRECHFEVVTEWEWERRQEKQQAKLF